MKRCIRLRSVAMAASTIALAACAAGERGSGLTGGTSVSTDCFSVSLARDFRYLDDMNLIVFAPARQPYHLELAPTCFGLRGEIAIGLSARTDRMCGFAGDAVLAGRGALRERCPVVSVRRLDDDQLQILIDQFEGPERGEGAIEVEIIEAPDGEAESGDDDAGEGGSDPSVSR